MQLYKCLYTCINKNANIVLLVVVVVVLGVPIKAKSIAPIPAPRRRRDRIKQGAKYAQRMRLKYLSDKFLINLIRKNLKQCFTDSFYFYSTLDK